MKTTVNDGLTVLLTMFPGKVLADLRAVWDKMQARQPLADDFERRVASEIGMNRPAFDYLLALEEAPVRSALEAKAVAALAENDTIIADGVAWLAANPNAAPVLRMLVDAAVKAARQRSTLIRLTLRKFDSVQGTAGAGGR